MLNHVTWGQFALVLAIILIIYYGFLLFKYYGTDFLRRKQADGGIADLQLSLFEQSSESDTVATALEPDPEVEAIDQLIAEVKKLAAIPSGDQAALATLRQNLKSVLQAYPGLKDSPHRPAINELIVSECEKHGQALLSEAEVDQWWEIPDRIVPLPGPAPMPSGWPR